MPQYSYKAKTASGETVEGVMQGETEASVLRTLQQRDLFPVHVLESDEEGGVYYGQHETKIKVKRRDVGVY
jgi:type II secretory pathway component PulF